MPRYDWRCGDCGMVFEAWARAESPLANCPSCLLPATKLFVPNAQIRVTKHFNDFVRSELEPARDDTDAWEARTSGSQYHKPKHLSYKEWLNTPEGRRG